MVVITSQKLKKLDECGLLGYNEFGHYRTPEMIQEVF
jgi:hypothetical protein